MRHAAPIAAPEDVAWFLASYARDALAGVRDVELSALAAVRAALEEALGLKFEGDKGEHFFRSSLVQTLFSCALKADYRAGWRTHYGLFPPAPIL
jgi:hypothetical protein